MDDTLGPVGTHVDALGARATIAPDDLVAGCVVLLKIVEPDGDVRLSLTWSEGMSWIERLGMLHAAIGCETPNGEEEI